MWNLTLKLYHEIYTSLHLEAKRILLSAPLFFPELQELAAMFGEILVIPAGDSKGQTPSVTSLDMGGKAGSALYCILFEQGIILCF